MTEDLDDAAALREVHELAGWYADDEADAEDESPDDMVAHVNGLIRQICAKALEGCGHVRGRGE